MKSVVQCKRRPGADTNLLYDIRLNTEGFRDELQRDAGHFYHAGLEWMWRRQLQAELSDEDSAFINKSVADYFARHQNASGTRTYQLVGGNYYDATTHWWIVPLDADGQKLQALLSCDGRIELSGR